MVAIKTLITLALTAFAYAAPVTEAEAVANPAGSGEVGFLEKRALGDVWVCYDYDWQGKCHNFIVPINGCVNFQDYYPFRPEDLPEGSGRRTPRSVGPSDGTWCLVYNDFWCSGQFGGAFTKPGHARIDGIKSIHCWF
ncbi:hypothetical protein ABW19_dt0206766 [Dactylella cylindrospora]|nr:hypothetical protein ABW19_dt0206766 [Dactylella cylindrospora]